VSAYFESLNRRAGRLASPPAAVRHAPAPVAAPIPAPAPVPAPVVAPRLVPGETLTEYAALRERLLVTANGTPLRALVFAGCHGGEGSTRVVRDFGETLAGSGLNVLLVDGDLRTAGLTTSTAARGADLLELVDKKRSLPPTPWGKGKLTVVPSPRAPHPDKERFLRDPEFSSWLDVQRSHYDYVLLDAPPLLRFADGTLIARLCDGVILVVRAEVTERDAVARAKEQLERAGVKVVGAILNRMRNPVPAWLRPYVSTE
jgi:capsular exopolysaccharide synthesis family protein